MSGVRGVGFRGTSTEIPPLPPVLTHLFPPTGNNTAPLQPGNINACTIVPSRCKLPCRLGPGNSHLLH